MSRFRRPQPEPDAVDVFARLAGYEATSTEGLDGRYASGYTFEPRDSADVPGHIAAPAHVPEERRGATRHTLQLPVRAKSRADDDWQSGHTVDASMTGLCIEMPCPPDETHLDVEIDSTETITAWARVVGVTLDEGAFRWRLRLVSYDASYSVLLSGLDPLASPDGEVSALTPVPVEHERVLADAMSCDELLVRATA